MCTPSQPQWAHNLQSMFLCAGGTAGFGFRPQGPLSIAAPATTAHHFTHSTAPLPLLAGRGSQFRFLSRTPHSEGAQGPAGGTAGPGVVCARFLGSCRSPSPPQEASVHCGGLQVLAESTGCCLLGLYFVSTVQSSPAAHRFPCALHATRSCTAAGSRNPLGALLSLLSYCPQQPSLGPAQLGSSPAWVQQMSCRAHATPRVHGGCGRLPCEAAARQLPWGCMAGGAVSCRRPWRPRCVLHATPRRQECPGCAACGGLLPLPCSLEMPAGRPQQAPLPPLGAGTGGGAGHPSPARAPRRTGAGWVAAAWLPGGAPALGRARPGGQLQHPGMHSPVLFPRGCRAACRCPCMPAATPVLPARPPARPGTFALPPVIASPPNASLTPASQPAACRHTAAPVSPSQC
jgi:hypothetical protein